LAGALKTAANAAAARILDNIDVSPLRSSGAFLERRFRTRFGGQS
jgi:hypothetical protein